MTERILTQKINTAITASTEPAVGLDLAITASDVGAVHPLAHVRGTHDGFGGQEPTGGDKQQQHGECVLQTDVLPADAGYIPAA